MTRQSQLTPSLVLEVWSEAMIKFNLGQTVSLQEEFASLLVERLNLLTAYDEEREQYLNLLSDVVEAKRLMRKAGIKQAPFIDMFKDLLYLKNKATETLEPFAAIDLTKNELPMDFAMYVLGARAFLEMQK